MQKHPGICKDDLFIGKKHCDHLDSRRGKAVANRRVGRQGNGGFQHIGCTVVRVLHRIHQHVLAGHHPQVAAGVKGATGHMDQRNFGLNPKRPAIKPPNTRQPAIQRLNPVADAQIFRSDPSCFPFNQSARHNSAHNWCGDDGCPARRGQGKSGCYFGNVLHKHELILRVSCCFGRVCYGSNPHLDFAIFSTCA